MAERVLRRPIVLIAALLVASAALVGISISESRASSHPLPDADSIVLEIESGNNRLVYGVSQQPLVAGASNCKLTTASVGGPIMSITATSVNKKGLPVLNSPVGLVGNGLGTSEKGNGNGQDCGLVDYLETITFALTDRLPSKLIEAVDVDLEGKFGGGARVTYYRDGLPVGVPDHLAMTENGSDNGPDARDGDNYYFSLPDAAANAGILFDAVKIEPDPTVADPGSVSVQGGGDWPTPSTHRTVFHLVSALDCGDDVESGGPDLTDNPLAHFVLGPPKVDGPCTVPVELTTTRQGEGGAEQVVNLAPPDGYSWDGLGVTGLLTVEWDVEVPDGLPIDRTFARVGGSDTVIPWCEDIILYLPSLDDDWSYDLVPNPDEADGRYPDATDGDLCLVDQSTATVSYDHDEDPLTDDIVMTQTTEIFYIWNDPTLVRF